LRLNDSDAKSPGRLGTIRGQVEDHCAFLATKDRTVHPELQRFVANRMGATTREVDSSHVPMLSNPVLVLGEPTVGPEKEGRATDARPEPGVTSRPRL